MALDSINHFITTDLAEHNITFHHCPKHADNKSPNSYIILNANTGTRTILHTNLGQVLHFLLPKMELLQEGL